MLRSQTATGKGLDRRHRKSPVPGSGEKFTWHEVGLDNITCGDEESRDVVRTQSTAILRKSVIDEIHTDLGIL